MCPDRLPFSAAKMHANRCKACAQRGFAMVSAVFLLVVLAALGAAMLTFSSSQHASSAMDIQGAQAYQSAQAGIEWGAYQVLRNNSCAGTTLTISGLSVVVACASTTYGSLTAYQITSTASAGTVGQLGRVERQLQAKIVK